MDKSQRQFVLTVCMVDLLSFGWKPGNDRNSFFGWQREGERKKIHLWNKIEVQFGKRNCCYFSDYIQASVLCLELVKLFQFIFFFFFQKEFQSPTLGGFFLFVVLLSGVYPLWTPEIKNLLVLLNNIPKVLGFWCWQFRYLKEKL